MSSNTLCPKIWKIVHYKISFERLKNLILASSETKCFMPSFEKFYWKKVHHSFWCCINFTLLICTFSIFHDIVYRFRFHFFLPSSNATHFFYFYVIFVHWILFVFYWHDWSKKICNFTYSYILLFQWIFFSFCIVLQFNCVIINVKINFQKWKKMSQKHKNVSVKILLNKSSMV